MDKNGGLNHESADYWLDKIANLKVDRAHGDPAPHKPLLLLAILDLAEEDEIGTALLPLSPELAFRFCSYWSIVAHRRSQKPDISLPFHHLRSDGFWDALDEQGRPSPTRTQTKFAALPSDLLHFLSDPVSRDTARRIIIAKYFRYSEQLALSAMLGLPKPRGTEAAWDAGFESPAEAQRAGREARFRINIVAAYNYTCALTGYRLTTISAGSIVDAAHIHPFANSRNNSSENGIALCKNAHWLFDQGLWTISDDYHCIVAVGKFSEFIPDGRPLTGYHGERLRLPEDRSLWPSPVHLSWHRRHVFQGF